MKSSEHPLLSIAVFGVLVSPTRKQPISASRGQPLKRWFTIHAKRVLKASLKGSEPLR